MKETIKTYKQRELKEIIGEIYSALTDFNEKDSFLLHVGASERALTHKLAVYLESRFPDWDVDCEYNRDRENPKRAEKEDLMLPDIIVHQRGQCNNLFVIEAKKNLKPSEEDVIKLKELTSSDRNFKYTFGFFIQFNNNSHHDVILFRNGNLVSTIPNAPVKRAIFLEGLNVNE
jgi:hypothetical protein